MDFGSVMKDQRRVVLGPYKRCYPLPQTRKKSDDDTFVKRRSVGMADWLLVFVTIAMQMW